MGYPIKILTIINIKLSHISIVMTVGTISGISNWSTISVLRKEPEAKSAITPNIPLATEPIFAKVRPSLTKDTSVNQSFFIYRSSSP